MQTSETVERAEPSCLQRIRNHRRWREDARGRGGKGEKEKGPYCIATGEAKDRRIETERAREGAQGVGCRVSCFGDLRRGRHVSTVERTWHTQDSQGQILALALG